MVVRFRLDLAVAPAKLNQNIGFELFCGIELFGRDLGCLARLVAEDRLDPQIAAELSWEAMPKALGLLGGGGVGGKIVLTLNA